MAGKTMDLSELEEALEEGGGGQATGTRELGAIYDIPVQVQAVLGKATMQVSQLLKLGRGAVVELDRKAGEASDIDVKLDIGRLIEALRSERITVPVVACGVSNDAGAAVRAIKAGAREYIPLPPNAELIAAVIEAVVEESNALIHNDPAMERLLKLADQIAPSEASVLITGESGTGKEVLARYLHRKSRRSAQKFVSLNCAAIPETLLESELFGHEKGAFTGAIARRLGKFEE